MTLKNYAKFEEELTCRFKITIRNLTNFYSRTQKSRKTCTLMASLSPKYIMFELKKYRGMIFNDTEEWSKIWEKTDLWFGKWHEEFRKFSPEHWKVSKLGPWWDPFIQSRICMSLKFVNATKMYQFKAKVSEITKYSLCLGNISEDLSVNNVKKARLNGCM